jgi:hypothetical protein
VAVLQTYHATTAIDRRGEITGLSFTIHAAGGDVLESVRALTGEDRRG